ncbi:MAG: hypothetical protein Q4A12_03045 [Eubacteriales bacterium]|nr:hypothetical protein [Eubacteriales bacterium]
MKKTICILLIVLMVLSLCACSSSEEDVTESEIVEEQNVNSGPVAKTVTYEESKNNLGARYTFTLVEFNTMLNEECKSLGDATLILIIGRKCLIRWLMIMGLSTHHTITRQTY